MIRNFIYRITTYFFRVGPIIDIMLIVVSVVFWSFLNRKLSNKHMKKVNSVLLVVGTITVFLLCVVNRIVFTRSVSLFPFQNISLANTYRLQLIILNTLFFVPIGLTLPFIIAEKVKMPIRITILFGFLLSLTVELLQLVLKRGTFETEDIILNTLGVAIGTLSYLICTRLDKKGSDKDDRDK